MMSSPDETAPSMWLMTPAVGPHLFAWHWGSIIRGHRWHCRTMTPLSTEVLSLGRPWSSADAALYRLLPTCSGVAQQAMQRVLGHPMWREQQLAECRLTTADGL